jgi:hypothetical protein
MLFANVFQDVQVLSRGIGVQAVKEISLQKVAKAKMKVLHITWQKYLILNGMIMPIPFSHY